MDMRSRRTRRRKHSPRQRLPKAIRCSPSYSLSKLLKPLRPIAFPEAKTPAESCQVSFHDLKPGEYFVRLIIDTDATPPLHLETTLIVPPRRSITTRRRSPSRRASPPKSAGTSSLSHLWAASPMPCARSSPTRQRRSARIRTSSTTNAGDASVANSSPIHPKQKRYNSHRELHRFCYYITIPW